MSSGWKYEGDRLLLVVSNYNEEPVLARLRIRPEKTLAEAVDRIQVSGLEGRSPAPEWEGKTLEVRVAGHDYRLVLLGSGNE